MTTKTTKTTAETVAGLFGDDGRRFSRTVQHPTNGAIEECLLETCLEYGARIRRGESEGRGSFVAYEFEDGSAIVACGGAAWDVRHPRCRCGYCWAGELSGECEES